MTVRCPSCGNTQSWAILRHDYRGVAATCGQCGNSFTDPSNTSDNATYQLDNNINYGTMAIGDGAIQVGHVHTATDTYPDKATRWAAAAQQHWIQQLQQQQARTQQPASGAAADQLAPGPLASSEPDHPHSTGTPPAEASTHTPASSTAPPSRTAADVERDGDDATQRAREDKILDIAKKIKINDVGPGTQRLRAAAADIRRRRRPAPETNPYTGTIDLDDLNLDPRWTYQEYADHYRRSAERATDNDRGRFPYPDDADNALWFHAAADTLDAQVIAAGPRTRHRNRDRAAADQRQPQHDSGTTTTGSTATAEQELGPGSIDGEVFGLNASIAYAAGLHRYAAEHGSAGGEGYIGHLTASKVTGTALATAHDMQEAFTSAAAAAERHAVELIKQRNVQEAYDQTPDAGDKNYLLDGR